MKASTPTSASELARTIENGRASKGRKNRYIVIATLILIGIGSYLSFRTQARAGSSMPTFITEPISKGDIAVSITVTGNLEPTNEVSVGSELSGTTREVYVDSNDQVTAGQALARLDTVTLENQLRAARAALESAQANLALKEATLKEAEATLKRQFELSSLSGGAVPSEADLAATEATAERARAEVLSAKAAISESEATVDTRENDLSKAIIRAPSDGIVLSRSIEPGQTVASSFTTPELFVIAEDLSKMKLEVYVAEADIGSLTQGQTAQFTVDAWPDRNFPAEVLKVSFGSEITDNVVTYETELSVDNSDLSLRPGMTATADIAVAKHTGVLLVPAAALRFQPNPPKGSAAEPGKESGNSSFLDSLIPRPPRPGEKNNGGNADRRGPPSEMDTAKTGVSTIWILEDGHPRPCEVEVGLKDGRYVEVSSPELSPGIEVITAETTPNG